MARISTSSPEKVVSIKQFLGINENQSGDTRIRLGEATRCENWRVTRDGSLRKRPGNIQLDELTKNIAGFWSGWVGGKEYVLAASNSKLLIVYNGNTNEIESPYLEIGTISTTGHVLMFAFDSKAYIIDGTSMYSWDGGWTGSTPNQISVVDGYIPLIANAIGPVGTAEAAGTLLEQVNKLTAKRRVWISPDGTNKKFQLPEKNLSSIDSVVDLGTGSAVQPTDYTADTTNGTVEFGTAPAVGTNSYEITYSVSSSFRSQVIAMKYSELYSGETDARVFLYGDGTNELFYSDIDYDGKPRADYFPDMNEIAVGDANTPVTGLIRHYSRLVCYKIDSTWSVSASTLTLEDGSLISSFYVIPVNRIIGNVAPGQVQLVLNSPRSLFRGDLYEWHSAKYGNLTNDERQAYRISDRIYSTLHNMNVEQAVCFDDNLRQEYYISQGNTTLVHNYAVDAWFVYTFGVTNFATANNILFMAKGKKIWRADETANADWHYDSEEQTDVSEAVNAYWESGSMDFGADYYRKYSSTIWVSVKPESSSYVEIAALTDKNETINNVKVVEHSRSGFSDWDFRSLNFDTKEMPQITKLKIKKKKFVYYKLVFTNDEANTNATILGVDIRMHQTGYAK